MSSSLASWQRRHPGLLTAFYSVVSVFSVHETSEVGGWMRWFVVAQSLTLIVVTGFWARAAWRTWAEDR